MKKMIILLVFVTAMQTVFAQDTANRKTQPLSVKEEYLKTSKRQKTAAIVLLSVGAAFVITSTALVADDLEDWDGGNSAAVESALFLTGAAAMLGSIPLFISAGKNRRRALSISLKNERTEMIQGNIVHLRSLPSVNFRISL